MKFILPLPPSINRTYGVSRSALEPLYIRKPVKDWQKEAGWELKQQLMKSGSRKKLPYLEKIRMEIIWYFLKNRDIDSGIKILLDFFQEHNIYENDQQVTNINMLKEFDAKNPRVEVEILPL